MVLVTTMITPPLLRLVFPRHVPRHELGEDRLIEETIAHEPEALEELP